MSKENGKISRRVNLNKTIKLGDKEFTILEYLKDTSYPAKIISIMGDNSCSALEAYQIMKKGK